VIESVQVGSSERGRPCVILLHGFAMTPEDLAPFARALGAPATFFFPRGGVTAHRADEPAARGWWPVDVAARERTVSRGPRDLSAQHPAGVDAARERLSRFVETLRSSFAPSHLIVGGFSQGAMLSLDWMLLGDASVDGLVLLSAARIRGDLWEPRWSRLSGVPVYQSHGQNDPDLSFAAAAKLRDRMVAAGAQVEWQEFAGGHEAPLVVWRSLKRFIQRIVSGARAP
jgi:phospholipase/carboxylesterase